MMRDRERTSIGHALRRARTLGAIMVNNLLRLKLEKREMGSHALTRGGESFHDASYSSKSVDSSAHKQIIHVVAQRFLRATGKPAAHNGRLEENITGEFG